MDLYLGGGLYLGGLYLGGLYRGAYIWWNIYPGAYIQWFIIYPGGLYPEGLYSTLIIFNHSTCFMCTKWVHAFAANK